MLVALILTFGPVSGAHINPAVTLCEAWSGGLSWRDVPAYLLAQISGAFVGVGFAHVMFGEPVVSLSQRSRGTPGEKLSEVVATFGLLAVIIGCSRRRPAAVPFAAGAYITAGFWFTASTSFANPAATLARAATDTFAGIQPVDVPWFLVAELCGAALATVFFQWLMPPARAVVSEGVVTREVEAA
jgi:glycerol uptake facilitator-like aquaporin